MITRRLEQQQTADELCGMDRRAISVVAGACNHLPANRLLEFRFEIVI